MAISHWDTDFSKLENLCKNKIFSFISTYTFLHESQEFFFSQKKQNPRKNSKNNMAGNKKINDVAFIFSGWPVKKEGKSQYIFSWFWII